MYHMKLDSFYEVSLPVGQPHWCRSENQRKQWGGSQRLHFRPHLRLPLLFLRY